jgi:ribosome-binding factor A
MTRRIAQVESTLQRAIAKVLQREVSDPQIRGLVSITRVKVSPDLAEARVFVSIMPARHEHQTMAGLHRATGRIRAITRKEVAIRSMPQLRFELDQSLKEQARVYEAIDQGIRRSGVELEPPTPDVPEPRDPDAE